jgi:hypothetical protein
MAIHWDLWLSGSVPQLPSGLQHTKHVLSTQHSSVTEVSFANEEFYYLRSYSKRLQGFLVRREGLGTAITMWPRSLARGLSQLACCECGFETHRENACLSLASVVCCQVKVPAMGRSLIQRIPTEYMWPWTLIKVFTTTRHWTRCSHISRLICCIHF